MILKLNRTLIKYFVQIDTYLVVLLCELDETERGMIF